MFKEMFQETDKRLQAAQATIADLQEKIAVERANKESAVACVDRDVKKISALQQRVAQLEGERDMYKRSSDTFAECVDNVREAMGLETTHYLVLPDDVADLKADHARVLGLLAQVTEIADMMLKGTECEHDVGLCSCEHRRIVKQAQRSLPAQPAQGGASNEVG